MTGNLQIEAEWLDGVDDDPIERSTFAQISVTIDGQSLTELEDLVARTTRSGLRGSAYRLAYWFAENWWRLRWEPESSTVEWNLAHMMTAIGGGYAWPDIRFASDGLHVLIESERTANDQPAPVRYLGNCPVQVAVRAFERGVDGFVECVLARLSAVQMGNNDLAALWAEVRRERADERVSALRQLEALLGFDAGEAPDDLIQGLLGAAESAGHKAVNEIAAAGKEHAKNLIQAALENTRVSNVEIRPTSISEVETLFHEEADMDALPWQRAEIAARAARRVWGVSTGPVSNEVLSELLQLPKDRLEIGPVAELAIAAGLRKSGSGEIVSIAQRAKSPTGRRFEIMRLVADHVIAPDDDHLLPVTAAKTDRQKFQRAFAAEFLLPFQEMRDALDRPGVAAGEISDEDIEDLAAQYQVSPLMVRTSLVNRGWLPREALDSAA
jgi:hypothetical protein